MGKSGGTFVDHWLRKGLGMGKRNDDCYHTTHFHKVQSWRHHVAPGVAGIWALIILQMGKTQLTQMPDLQPHLP